MQMTENGRQNKSNLKLSSYQYEKSHHRKTNSISTRIKCFYYLTLCRVDLQIFFFLFVYIFTRLIIRSIENYSCLTNTTTVNMLWANNYSFHLILKCYYIPNGSHRQAMQVTTDGDEMYLNICNEILLNLKLEIDF